MYIQITNRCNMSCSHCCFDCGPIGNDMSLETFKAAAIIARDYDADIFIGGGEPTLHHDFWAIMGLALAYSQNNIPGINTNGSATETAFLLASMAQRGIIYAGLSLDIYHDPIDSEVIQAFTFLKKDPKDNREIRDVSHPLIAAGRSLDDPNADKTCCICSDIFVDPLGNIYSCGCKTKELGTVWNPSPDLLYSCLKEDVCCADTANSA